MYVIRQKKSMSIRFNLYSKFIIIWFFITMCVWHGDIIAQESLQKGSHIASVIYELGAALAIEGAGIASMSLIDMGPEIPLFITGIGMITVINAIGVKTGYIGSVPLAVCGGLAGAGMCFVIALRAGFAGDVGTARLSLLLPALGLVLGYNAGCSAIEPESLPHRAEALGFLLHAPTCVTDLKMSPHGTLYRQVNFNLINVSF